MPRTTFLVLLLCAVPLAGLAAASGPVDPALAESAEAGDVLPDFTVVDRDGVPSTSHSFLGRTLLLDFWATWCRPCQFTLPELDRLHGDFAERDDFAVVGFSIDEGRVGRLRAYRMAREAGLRYSVYHDDASKPLHPQLGIEAIPVLLLVDPEGRIVRRWDGEPDFSEVRAAVIELLGTETSTDPAGR